MDILRIQQQASAAGFGYEDPDGVLGRATYASLFSFMADRHLGDLGLGLGDGCVKHLTNADITTACRLSYFLAETAANTNGFRDLEERLSHPDATIWLGFEDHRDPREIALSIYSGRMGNGGRETNDGWRYRARGLIPIVGRAAYARWGEEVGLPLLAAPELASDPESAAKIACTIWASTDLNKAADLNNPTMFCQATGRVNVAEAPRPFIEHLRRAESLLL